MAVVQDAVHFSKARWRQEPAAPGAPLAVRLAAFHGAMVDEMGRSFCGLDPVLREFLSLMILKGVIEAGEDADEVEAAIGVNLR